MDTKDTAQTAMILSIVGLFIFGFLGIIGMILGFQAMSQMNRSGTQSGHGMAAR